MSRRAIDMQDLKDLKRTKTAFFSPLDREGQALALRYIRYPQHGAGQARALR